jgi:glutathione S-transferase
MLTLIEFPWSPFCIAIRRILQRNRIPYRSRNVSPYRDRSEIIRLTKGRGYTLPCLLDGRRAVVDETDFGQEVARYLDRKFRLGLFPADKEGVQAILARYIENEIEGIGFKVNDSYVIPRLPLVERVNAVRWKERKFGRGCVTQWAADRARLNAQMDAALEPLDAMLAHSLFLLGARPLFVDYDLFGMLGNYLYNGRTRLPRLKHLTRWHSAMGTARRAVAASRTSHLKPMERETR